MWDITNAFADAWGLQNNPANWWSAPVDNGWTIPTDNTPTDPKPTDQTPKYEDKDWGYRHTISYQKETIKTLQEQLNALKNAPAKPEFNDETDPDWNKQIEWVAQQKAEQMVQEQLWKLWLDDKLAELKKSEFETEFFGIVDNYKEEFTALWLDNFDRKAIKEVVNNVYDDQKGLTPKQAIILANAEKIWERLNTKTAPAPDNGWEKTQSTTKLSQEQIYDNIFAKAWI